MSKSRSGPDSLASVRDVSMFGELAEARRIAPKVPARALLRSATLAGATGLGFGNDFGSIEPGKRAALIAVRVPERVTDVEEYLVSPDVDSPSDICAIADRRRIAAGTCVRDINAESPPLLRAIQPFGVRPAVCADRGTAGMA